MLDGLVAVLLNSLGIAMVYVAWRNRAAGRRKTAIGGWAMVILAAWWWIRVGGVEFGGVYVVLFSALAAWAAVLYNSESGSGRNPRQSEAQKVVPDRATLVRHTLRFVVAVPVGAAASAFAGVAILRWLPITAIDAAALAMLLIPVLWGLSTFWSCADPRLQRPAFGISTAGLLGAAVVFSG